MIIKTLHVRILILIEYQDGDLYLKSMVHIYNISKVIKYGGIFTIKIALKWESRNFTEVHLSKGNCVRNQHIKEIPDGTLPINLEPMNQYQRKYPSLMAKYKEGTYHKDYFSGGSNIDLNLIKCEDKFVIPSIIQIYILHWYHRYLFHPGMHITEAMIQHDFYKPGIRDVIRKEVTNCDTC